jgi:acyl-CoA synthetase (AMP-forming)/AMP-acid ligase II
VPVGGLAVREFGALGCAGGEIGEIVVAGRHVLTAYADSLRNPDTRIDVEGTVWHRTGDAGYLDNSGRLWLVGRLSAGIRDELGTVYPFQVEYAVQAAAGVGRAALIELNGRRTLVVEGGGRALQARYAALARCIEHFHIERIRSLSHIPMDRRHNAKIDYPALRRQLDGRLDAVRLRLVESVSRIFRLCRRWACSTSHAIVRHPVRNRLPATLGDRDKARQAGEIRGLARDD